MVAFERVDRQRDRQPAAGPAKLRMRPLDRVMRGPIEKTLRGLFVVSLGHGNKWSFEGLRSISPGMIAALGITSARSRQRVRHCRNVEQGEIFAKFHKRLGANVANRSDADSIDREHIFSFIRRRAIESLPNTTVATPSSEIS